MKKICTFAATNLEQSGALCNYDRPEKRRLGLRDERIACLPVEVRSIGPLEEPLLPRSEALGGENNPIRRIVHVQEFACRSAAAPDDDFIAALFNCIDALLNQRRNHMRTCRVEVIPRTIQIYWEKKDRIEPVLCPIRLRL